MSKIRLVIALLALVHIAIAQDFEVSPVLMNFNADPGENQKNSSQ